MKVKVGPIVAEYSGTATVVEMNETDRTVKLTASGRDKRGAGNASADIFASMVEADGGTTVSIATDLKVAGKVAQFGRGAWPTSPRNCSGSSPSASRPNCSRLRPSPSRSSGHDDRGVEGPPATASSRRRALTSILDDDDVLDLMDVAGGVLGEANPRLSPVSSPSSST